jgi:hypothetical protein
MELADQIIEYELRHYDVGPFFRSSQWQDRRGLSDWVQYIARIKRLGAGKGMVTGQVSVSATVSNKERTESKLGCTVSLRPFPFRQSRMSY